MTYGTGSYGATPYGAGDDAGLTLYWAIQPSGTANWADDATGGAQIRAGQDGAGSALPAGSYGSQAYTAAGQIDMAVAASGLTPGQSYEFGFVLYDSAAGEYSNVQVSAAFVTTANTGASAVTLDALAALATGALTPLAGTGEAAITLGGLTASAAGALAITGGANVTLGAATLVATGDLTALAGTGEALITLGALTSAAVGAVAIKGAAAFTLGALTVAAEGAGAQINAGTAAITLGELTASAAGALAIKAAAGVTLGDLTAAATGTVDIAATLGVTLGDLVLAATGSRPNFGHVSVTLGALTVAATGVPVIQTVYSALSRQRVGRTPEVAPDMRIGRAALLGGVPRIGSTRQ